MTHGAIRDGASQREVQGERQESTGALAARLSALEQVDLGGLKGEWRRLYGTEPPQLSRDLILRAVAYRIQERALGGHSKAILRRLANLASELRAGNEITVESSPRLRPGARLVREWRGRTHTVDVGENGFAYAGTTYASLTTIAKVITGAHWSGPRFFGLVKRSTPSAEAASRPAATEDRAAELIGAGEGL